MSQVVERTHTLLERERLRRDPPVRIAILDSGVDKHLHALEEVHECRGFAPLPSHDYFDRVGHGTHSIGLLRKVAPNARIYVAKVTEADEAGKRDVPNHVSIANASY
jgi:subtilisin family serine protease